MKVLSNSLLCFILIGLLNIPLSCAEACVGMTSSNLQYSLHGNVISFKWTPVDGDFVNIKLYDNNDNEYKDIKTVRMQDGKFDYESDGNGYYDFLFLNECNEARFIVEISGNTPCKGMNFAHVSHVVNNDEITLKWDDVGGENVYIGIYDDETQIYIMTGSLKMSDKEFKYKIEKDGLQKFLLYNDCNLDGIEYKVAAWRNQDNQNEGSSNSFDKKDDNIKKFSWYREGNQKEMLSNGYTIEFNNAYVFAYKNGITTMGTIEKANLNGGLTRIAMAKMLVNYAINVLDKKPANKVVPKFSDITQKLNDDYGGAVDLAYQLGIMGIGTDKFRPYDSVTRKEFGTALSRMLFGLADGTYNYYSTHLAKLKAEGIINNDNPNLKELRGYVMLMLMRSAMNK